MSNVISEQDALDLIIEIVDEEGSQSAAANRLGISAAYLSDILSGARSISDKVANKLGYSKVSMYEKQDWEVND